MKITKVGESEKWGGFDQGSVAYPNFRTGASAINLERAAHAGRVNLTGGDQPERLSGRRFK